MRTRNALSALVTAVAVLATGCAAAQAEAPPLPVSRGVAASVPAADAGPYAAGDMTFGMNLLRAWCQQDPRQNIVFSPATLASSLGEAYLGARGATAAAMARVLHLPSGVDLAGLRARYNALTSLNGPGVTVSADDRVWADPSLPTSAAFLNAVATAYRAGVTRVPTLTDQAAAVRQINAAIAAATRGHITNLLSPDQLRDIGWVLTAAMYLDAKWATPFDASLTGPQTFTTAAGARVLAPSMRRAGVQVGSSGGWTSVTLPYQGGKLSMVALLPPSSAGGSCAVPASLPTATVTGSVALPKVDLRTKDDASGLLRGLGMGIAFSQSGADFSGISRAACCIGFVQQAATLRVDEKGTVASAAAATGIVALSGQVPVGPQVVFNRPYLLLITTSGGEPLFLARVANPLAS